MMSVTSIVQLLQLLSVTRAVSRECLLLWMSAFGGFTVLLERICIVTTTLRLKVRRYYQNTQYTLAQFGTQYKVSTMYSALTD